MQVNDLDVAIKAAIRASEIIAESYGNFKELDFKSDIDVVTEVDFKCEEAITKILQEETPEYGIIAEEGTSFPGEKVWIVDPLDGTINFSHSFPLFGPSIGLCKGNEVLIGVIADPIRKELFYASKGNGAFLNDLYNKGEPKRLHVSKIKNITVEGVSGSNSVKVTLNGEGEMTNIYISPETTKEEKTIIEDLIVAAHNNAKSKLKIKTSEEISKATGGFGIPGFKWPF